MASDPVAKSTAEAGDNARAGAGGGPGTCRHCGSPLLTDTARSAGFCCAGCAYVHRLVREGGFDRYYRLKDRVIAPVDSGLFQPRDHGWLAALQRKAEAHTAVGPASVDQLGTRSEFEGLAAGAKTSNHGVPASGRPPGPGGAGRAPGVSRPREGTATMVLDLQGISCVGCVWLVEKLFEKEPGALRLELNAQLGRMRLTWEAGRFDAVHFARTLQSFGYLAGPPGAEPAGPPESRELAKRIGLCAAFWMNVMLFTLPVYFGMTAAFTYARLFGTLAMVFGTLSFLAGGTYFLERAARALRDGVMHIDLPIALGIVGAYAASVGGWITGASDVVYFDFVASFILLMLIGRWAQVAAVERNRRRLLRHRAVAAQLRVFDGAGAPAGEASAETLEAGRVFELPMGHTLPVEARLLGGDAVFTTAWINGEAEARLFRPGQRVPAGAVNVTRGGVRLEAVQSWGDSLLTRLLQTDPRPGYRQRLLERVIRGYLVAILGLALAAGAGWALAASDARRALAVAIAVLVVSCPCALGLALPLADEMATAAARRAGVFVRENDLWARLGRVRKIIFDKTGTLTLEVPALANPEALAALAGPDRAALLALVRDNPHPVSQRLHEELLIAGGAEPLPGTPQEDVGFGVSLRTPSGTWTLGRPGWRPAAGAGQTIDDVGMGAGDAEFSRDGSVLARFRFVEAVRPDVPIEVAALGAGHRNVYLLSGDRRDKVEAIARQLGLPPERAVAEAPPEAKAGWVRRLDRQDTLMLGDGANDSLAFEHAFCRGTPVVHRGVLEQKSDFYYLGGGVGGIRRLFAINRARARTQAWILAFAVAYNAAAVGFAAAGRVNPLVAAVLMPASALLTLAITGLGMRKSLRA